MWCVIGLHWRSVPQKTNRLGTQDASAALQRGSVAAWQHLSLLLFSFHQVMTFTLGTWEVLIMCVLTVTTVLWHLEIQSLTCFCCHMLVDLCKNVTEHNLQTVVWTSQQRLTTFVTSVCVEYDTDMERAHTTGEGQFLSCALPPLSDGWRKITSSYLSKLNSMYTDRAGRSLVQQQCSC